MLASPVAVYAQEAGGQAENEVSADTAAVDTAEPADEAVKPAEAETAEAKPAEAAAEGAAGGDIRSDFVNFLHFAVIGRFDYAQAHAKSLLQRPDVSPLSPEAAKTLIELSQERPDAIETLVILINNSTIGEEAGKIMGLIREAHRTKRMNPENILQSIRMLAGNPTEQATGLERLIDSGEYAIPHMLGVLADAHESALHPYVVRALPRIGKPAVNPLAAALSVNDEVVQRAAAEALGRLGYPQALPYLKRAAVDPNKNEAIRQTASNAIRQIVVADPEVKDSPAPQLFQELAEAYYAEEESLCPDSQLPRANVWVVDGPTVKAIDVPREIFCMVMSMQTSKASLELVKNQPAVLALWLAANFRREARLGLDVQTAEKAAVDDPTRPADFPRSIYWARTAGPQVCSLVLARALTDKDRPVALGAIAGLAAVAGPNAFQVEGRQGPGLAEAIRFPDQLVRLRAAFVLARILPKTPFPGANEVVPVLASAFSIDGKKTYLVIEPDQKVAETIVGDLKKSGADALAAPSLELGLARASKQFDHLDAIFLGSDMVNPGPLQAVQTISRDERVSLTPVVMAVKEGGLPLSDQVADADPRIGRVLVSSGSVAPLLTAKAEQISRNYGYQPLTAEDGVSLSLEAIRSLQRIAAPEYSPMYDASASVFDPRVAEPALVKALNTHPAEQVRIGATRVLALLNTPTAQDAIAQVALATEQTPTLRMAAFASLAESARQFGNRLNEKSGKQLIAQAMNEPNLELRTAASQALGATINMPAELAVEAILNETSKGD